MLYLRKVLLLGAFLSASTALAQDQAQVNIYENIDYQGTPLTVTEFGSCIELLHSGIPRVGSVNMNTAAQEASCIFHGEHGCVGSAVEVRYPGTNDFAKDFGGFEPVTVICFKNE
ncbi:hypothetical protein MferCBS31731_002724 [Microsporum ferrugineum]